MTNEPNFADFIDRITQRALPRNSMARVRTLAKELAEGAAEGHWNSIISHFRGWINVPEVLVYLLARWSDLNPQARSDAAALNARVQSEELSSVWSAIFEHGAAPGLDLLVNNGYITVESNQYTLTRAAFDLIEETEPTNIFISYRRKDSSAFALLVLTRLKMAGLEPFLDLALVPGEDWHEGLRSRIQRYDYFILLVGQETLSSSVVIEEISWALEANLTILPIWHNGFSYRSDQWNLPPAVDEALRLRHTIRVVEENPLAYNNAILELLNRFGVTL